MARQGGRMQLEQAVMQIALNMIHMTKHGILGCGMEKTTHFIKKLQAEI
jgi:hypothetical protein